MSPRTKPKTVLTNGKEGGERRKLSLKAGHTRSSSTSRAISRTPHIAEAHANTRRRRHHQHSPAAAAAALAVVVVTLLMTACCMTLAAPAAAAAAPSLNNTPSRAVGAHGASPQVFAAVATTLRWCLTAAVPDCGGSSMEQPSHQLRRGRGSVAAGQRITRQRLWTRQLQQRQWYEWQLTEQRAAKQVPPGSA